MHLHQVPWGLLTFLAYYVVLYEDPQTLQLNVSDALPYDQKSPTIVMIMYFIIRENFLALQTRHLPTPLAPRAVPIDVPAEDTTPLLGRSALPAESRLPHPPQPDPSATLTQRRTSPRFGGSISESSTGVSQASALLGTSPTSTLDVDLWETLRMGDPIGAGRSGTIFKATYQGRAAAVKAVNLSDPEFDQKVLELKNEKVVYHHLASLSGDMIPKLLAFGFCPKLNTWVLVTEYLDGEHPQPGTMSTQQRLQAVTVLKRIHDMGVKHNDPRPENILLVGSRVVFLDFGSATVGDSKERRKAEMRLFQNFIANL